MKLPDKCCGNCRWSANRNFTATGRYRIDSVVRCTWPMPTIAILPLAITESYGFRGLDQSRNWMEPTTSIDCPTWEAEVKP